MGYLYFAINSQTCCQILRFFTGILLQFKLLAAHFGLLKTSPAPAPESPFQRPTSHVFLTEGSCPSLVTIPATELQARIKNTLPIVEFGDFVEKQRIEFDGVNRRCTICLCDMKRSETMRELCNCSHFFHRECLDTWIDEFQITCPVCRSLLFPADSGDGFLFFR